MSDYLDELIAGLGVVVAWFFGPLDSFMKILIAFTVIDYVSGIMAGYEAGNLSSAVGFKGIAKKIMMFALVGLCNVLDGELFGNSALIRDVVICFYLSNEGISILENAVVCGLPVPEKLKSKLLELGDEEKPQEGEDVIE